MADMYEDVSVRPADTERLVLFSSQRGLVEATNCHGDFITPLRSSQDTDRSRNTSCETYIVQNALGAASQSSIEESRVPHIAD